MRALLLLAWLTLFALTKADNKVILRVQPISAAEFKNIVGDEDPSLNEGRLINSLFSGLSDLTAGLRMGTYINNLFGGRNSATLNGYPLCTINARPEARQMDSFAFDSLQDQSGTIASGVNANGQPVINCVLVVDERNSPFTSTTVPPTVTPTTMSPKRNITTNTTTLIPTTPPATTPSPIPVFPPPPPFQQNYPWYPGYAGYPGYPGYPYYNPYLFAPYVPETGHANRGDNTSESSTRPTEGPVFPVPAQSGPTYSPAMYPQYPFPSFMPFNVQSNEASRRSKPRSKSQTRRPQKHVAAASSPWAYNFDNPGHNINNMDSSKASHSH